MKKLLLSILCAASFTAYAGTGTAADPYSVAEVIAMGADLNVASATVKGYIVGYVNGQVISTGAKFTTEGAAYSNVLIADAQNCTDVTACVPVQLVQKTDIRAAVNLGDNPGNFGKSLAITGQLTKYFGVPGVKEPTAYTIDGVGTTPDTPDTPSETTATFGYVKTVTSGKQYAIVCDSKVAVPNTGNYGYLSTADATVSNNQITTAAANAFTIEAVDGGYTIKDSNGKYLVQTGTYNSFNYMTSAGTEGVWTIEPQDNGTMKITNVGKNKYIQLSSYGTFGSYETQNGTMPMLYELGNAGTDLPQVEIGNAASIAEFLSMQSANPVKINAPVTAVYQNGNRLYITDGTTPLLVFGALEKTYKNGDVIAAGITGTYQNFSNGNLQMSTPVAETFAAGVAGAEVTPDVYQVEELSADMVSAYVEIHGVSLVADGNNADGKTFVLTDNTASITLYNQFEMKVGAGENLTFKGFVAVHNGKTQLLPIVDLGEVVDGGDTPDADDANVAYFIAPEFTDKAGCALVNKDGSTELANDDAKVEAKGLNDKLFTEKGVSLKFSHGDGEYHASAFGKQVRWYQGETATLTPAAGVKILKVFVQTVANSKGNFTATAGTVDGTGVGANNPITWTGSVSTGLVLTTVKQVRFSYIEVTTEGFSGVEDVTVSDENAPVEYYNLQGVRVNNPENGVYIRRQGNTVTKVLVK